MSRANDDPPTPEGTGVNGAAGLSNVEIQDVVVAAEATPIDEATPDVGRYVFRGTLKDGAPVWIDVREYFARSKYAPHQGERECARRAGGERDSPSH
ncbi:MAG: hypothetical protein ACREQA_16015 [Candidatus Binatia bacterium]